ncbi:MAG: hypothetical protein JRE47_13185 [Deltaproteobacteria bacterium]|nr:hypothetical protein [Deltaproteobacteria bacterium]
MTGRTVGKHSRIYIDGYDMSQYTKAIGNLSWTYEVSEQAALTDEVKNGLPGHAMASPGVLSGFLDNTATSGLHAVLSGGTGTRTVMVPLGMRAAPAAGDPVFAGQFEQLDYISTGEDYVNAAVTFGGWSNQATSLAYEKPWGTLLHAKSAATGANTSNSGLSAPKAASSGLGGFLVYQVFSGNGTATISVDDSADNSSWLALSGATTGEINFSTVKHGMVALGVTATVRRYLRWQISLNSATTVTFALAFIRPEAITQ